VTATIKLEDEYESKFDNHSTTSADMTEELKICLSETCESEKNEIRVTLAD